MTMPASPLRRSVAGAIDLICFLAPVLLIQWLLPLLFIPIWWVAYIALVGSGQTLGKRLAGVMVVAADGSRANTWRVIARFAVQFSLGWVALVAGLALGVLLGSWVIGGGVGLWLWAFAGVLSALSPGGRGLWDRITNTMVIQRRFVSDPGVPIPPDGTERVLAQQRKYAWVLVAVMMLLALNAMRAHFMPDPASNAIIAAAIIRHESAGAAWAADGRPSETYSETINGTTYTAVYSRDVTWPNTCMGIGVALTCGAMVVDGSRWLGRGDDGRVAWFHGSYPWPGTTMETIHPATILYPPWAWLAQMLPDVGFWVRSK